MKKIAITSMAVCCLAAISNLAFAVSPGLYLGAGLGGSNLDTPSKYDYHLSPELTNQMQQKRNANGLAGRAFVGYNLTEYFGIEGGYAKYGISKYTGSLIDNNVYYPYSYNNELKYDLSAFDLVGKGYAPLSKHFSLYGLAGVAYVSSKFAYERTLTHQDQINTKTINEQTKKFRPIYGLGASYDIPKTNLTTNIEYSYLQGIGNTQTSSSAIPSANLVTLNISYNFG